MSRLRLTSTLALALGLTAVAAAPSGAAAASCASRMPSAVRVAVAADGASGVVSWRRPAEPPPKLSFRISRDGEVVGQTSGRRKSVALAPSRRTVIAVTAVVAGRPTSCRVTRTVRGRGSAPAQTIGLRTRLVDRGRSLALAWDPAAPGAHPVVAYRVLRDKRLTATVTTRSTRLRLPARGSATVVVIAVDGGGRTGRASEPVVLRPGHRPPTVPPAPAATEVTPTTATLSWGRSRAVGAKLKGYRLLRAGRTVRSTAALSARLENLRRTAGTYRVMAVDALGWTSSASSSVTVVPAAARPPATPARTPAVRGPRVPPGVPGAPRATRITDTQVTLEWAAAALPAGSVLRGYRLMRDGEVVTQVPGTSADVGGLAPASTHDWSVAAVDSQGLASEASAPTRVVQADPPAATGGVHVYLLASTDASYAAFRKHYSQIHVVYPTFFDCSTTGAITGTYDGQITRWAQARKVQVLPRYNCQRTDVEHRILTEPALRQQWIDTMVQAAVVNGWDGINLDFEAVLAADRDLLTAFVADLADRLHAEGKLLSQAVSAKTRDVLNHPRSTAFDYLKLTEHADWLFVMAWGIHWATGTPGAQDELPWVKQVRDYVVSLRRPQKFVMGTMLYGMDWPAGGGPLNPGVGRYYSEIQALAAAHAATPTYDPVKGSWRLLYTDEAGVGHEAWFSDAQTVGDRVALADDAGLGIGFWRVGQEDERIWSDPRIPQAPG